MLLYNSCVHCSPWQYYVEIVTSGGETAYRLVRMYLALGQKFVYDQRSAAGALNVADFEYGRSLRHSETRSECTGVIAHRNRAALLAITSYQEAQRRLERDSCASLLKCSFVDMTSLSPVWTKRHLTSWLQCATTRQVRCMKSTRQIKPIACIHVSTQSAVRLAWAALRERGRCDMMKWLLRARAALHPYRDLAQP